MSQGPIVFTFAARITSPLNGSQAAIYETARRRSLHRGGAFWHTQAAMRRAGAGRRELLPAIITITRVAPKKLDDDNLAAGCKSVRDGIADALQIDDGGPLVSWRYAQRAGSKQYGVEVLIERVQTSARKRVAR